MGFVERECIRLLEAILEFSGRSPNSSTKATQPGHLVLGQRHPLYERGRNETLFLSLKDLNRHVFLLGATGSGKSVAMVNLLFQCIMARLPGAMADGHDLVPKVLRGIAELVTKGQIPHSSTDRFVVVAPGDHTWTTRYNLLASETPIDAVRKTVGLVNILRALSSQDAFGPQTEETMRNALLLLAQNGRPLTHIEKVFRNTAYRTALASNAPIDGVREYWTRYSTLSPAMQNRLAEPVLNKLTVLLFDPRFRAMLDSSESDIDLRRAMGDGRFLLFDLNKGQLSNQAAMLCSSILLDFQAAMYSRADLPPGQRRLFPLFVDEFPSYAGAPFLLEPILNEGRKFLVGLVLAAQSMQSIDHSLLSSIRSNCWTQLYFRLSPDDAEAATSGLPREQRQLLVRQIISLPVGSAVLIQGGEPKGILRVPNSSIPDQVCREGRQLIEQMRHNIGRSLNLNKQCAPAPAQPNVPSSSQGPTTIRPPKRSFVTREPGFVEGDS